MITWMQKHNKFLVWTIWVATISFIGTGAVVGIGSGGRQAGTIAKVGEIEIKQSDLNMAYSSLYSQYNEMMKGNFDDKKAKEMGLVQQAFSRVETQAQILNFALEVGIIVSDKEVATKLQTIPAFQKDNLFNQDIYKQYLLSQRVKAKVFEERLRDDLLIQKTLALLEVEPLPLEEESMGLALNISDKIAYDILTPNDIDFKVKEEELKPFWENQKENYMTHKKYTLSIVWTPSHDKNTTEKEAKAFYKAHSYEYSNAQGKTLSFKEANASVIRDLKLKKTKKEAQKAYIAFKKNKIKATQTITLALGDPKLTSDIWKELNQKKQGDILKPKINSDRYATIKIDTIIEPRVKTYEEAKAQIRYEYEGQGRKKALLSLAEKKLETFDVRKAITSDFIKLEQNIRLKKLTQEESLQFAQKLFTSSKEKGMISLTPKIVIYSVLKQKFTPVDENQTNIIKESVSRLKTNTLQSNLIKILGKKYQTEVYVEGLKN